MLRAALLGFAYLIACPAIATAQDWRYTPPPPEMFWEFIESLVERADPNQAAYYKNAQYITFAEESEVAIAVLCGEINYRRGGEYLGFAPFILVWDRKKSPAASYFSGGIIGGDSDGVRYLVPETCFNSTPDLVMRSRKAVSLPDMPVPEGAN